MTTRLVAFIGASLFATCAQAQTIDGEWVGKVGQNQNGGSGSTMEIRFTSADEAEARYPEIKCAGRMTRIATSGEFHVFRENIVVGLTCPNSIATFVLFTDGLAFSSLAAKDGRWAATYGLLRADPETS